MTTLDEVVADVSMWIMVTVLSINIGIIDSMLFEDYSCALLIAMNVLFVVLGTVLIDAYTDDTEESEEAVNVQLLLLLSNYARN